VIEKGRKKDIRDRTARTGHPGQDSRDRTAGTGQPGQDSRDRTPVPENGENIFIGIVFEMLMFMKGVNQ
jgi:ribosomal protein L15